MRIPREIVDEIVARNDIEQTIGSYVTLKRAGSNLHGLCPFHNEKTPSFTVFPATKSFYCFGCGAGGDVVSFIMREENLDYVGALEHLAARAGIRIPEDRNALSEEPGIPRARIYEMNLAAARFFRECLVDKQYGAEGLRYLTESRGLSMATVRHFGLGFAPDHWWMLSNHLKKLGFTEEEMIAGFLCKRSEKSGKIFDLFRNRVIFPVIDTSGNVIAFGGRVMDDSKPKYLNSSDTPVFKKSRHLFALNFAKKQSSEEMILCEGYMDVIALHAAGFENAVATLGTAITSEQARVFAKYTKRVVICYDSDTAGQTAATKAMRLLEEVGVEVRVLKLVGAKDPDEYIKNFGAEAFRRVLKESVSGFDFRLSKILSGYQLELADEKIKASQEICAMIAEYSSFVERDIYIQRAAGRLSLSVEAMKADVERQRKKRQAQLRKKESTDAMLSVKKIDDRINTDAAKHIRAGKAEETLLGLLLIYEEYRREAASGTIITAADFSTVFGRRVFEAICRTENSEFGFSKAMLGEDFSPEELGRIEKLELDRRNLSRNDRRVFEGAICAIKEEKERNESGTDLDAELRRRQSQLKKQKENKNT